MTYLHQFVFGYFPYIALTVFLVGSLIRFDREQYTWRSGSSQLLRKDQLNIGSNLFHIGILLLFFGHLVGMLTPPAIYHSMGMTAAAKQALAMIAGGVFGVVCLVGMGILIHRRMTDPRILKAASTMDMVVMFLLLAQLLLGLLTIPFSAGHPDGATMVALADWAQRIVTFRAGAAEAIADVGGVYKLHIFLGLWIFIIFPFSRLVHIWSAPIWYLGRPYQIVRTRFRRAA